MSGRDGRGCPGCIMQECALPYQHDGGCMTRAEVESIAARDAYGVTVDSLCDQVATLTRERDEARSLVEKLHATTQRMNNREVKALWERVCTCGTPAQWRGGQQLPCWKCGGRP